MQKFATSVYSISISAIQKAELHICLHSGAQGDCAECLTTGSSAGSAGSGAGTNHLAWQSDSTNCHWHETGTHAMRKQHC